MAKSKTAKIEKNDEPDICGIIMPISAMGDYSRKHWSEVRQILDQAVEKVGMVPRIVSDSFETEIIQSRIIKNLYENPVVVCDVSGLNPNVMFELGIRITFKRPVIIVADDKTKLPFDTAVIEHQFYPASLHFHKVNDFVDELAAKIERMAEQNRDGSFKSFIEQFGEFQVLEPSTTAVDADQLVLQKLSEIEKTLSNSRSTQWDLNPRPSMFSKVHSPEYRWPEKLITFSDSRPILVRFDLDQPAPTEDKISRTAAYLNDQPSLNFQKWVTTSKGSTLEILISDVATLETLELVRKTLAASKYSIVGVNF